LGYRTAEYSRIVVGAGAMGSASAYFLSKVAGSTLVLERFHENHTLGSSHGRTRILRTAYAEGAAYVPLVLRARRLWQQLGAAAQQEIFRPTGVILAGRSDSAALGRAQASARRWKLPHERLDARDAAQRFPPFRFAPEEEVLWDPQGGVLFPERAIAAFRRLAHRRGVSFRWNHPVSTWSIRPDGRLLVRTARHDYLADELVLSAGAWMPGLVPELAGSLTVEQQTVYWFRSPGPIRRLLRDIPAFVWYRSEGSYSYGTPDFGGTVKLGGSHGRRVRDPLRRPASSARELRSILAFRARHLPTIGPVPFRKVTCLYTNTPDKNFIVDFHPASKRVLIVSACSGHGFKFASAVGEVVADAVRTGRLSRRVAPFGFPS
jgi:sarcosine oxidase